jgi:hypothetical protein
MSDEHDKADLREPPFQERYDELLASRKEFLHIFKRGAEFTEELLKENERLRYKIADLEARLGTDGGDEHLVKELMEKIRRLEEERERYLQRFVEVEAENKDFASRYVQIENENNNLMNIYVASYQLHSTLDFQEVLQIITEIVLNFVGAEVFAIALLDERKGDFHPLVAEGVDRDGLASLSVSEGIVGDVVREGEPYFASDVIENRAVVPAKPAICIPLKIKERIIGVILVYRFLPQKTELATVDHELFTLLAGHAATAIFSAKLYTDSRRKLNTIQGLIDLVTS